MSIDEKKIGGIDVSRETFVRLEVFVSLLEKWTNSINLVSPKSVLDIWARHIEDSAQIFMISPKRWRNWIDLGSGGGLPALVVAIIDEENQPITLVESDKRKCLFLNTVRRELDLNVTILNQRIETLKPLNADIVSARALAPLPNLLLYAEQILADDGVAIFAKGDRYQQDLDLARQTWDFDLTTHTSHTNFGSRILEISRVRRHES